MDLVTAEAMGWDLKLYRLAFLDLDGVLMDEQHRTHLALAKKWHEYFSLIHLDGYFPEGRDLHDALVMCGFGIAYLTTRREDLRSKTMTSLEAGGYDPDAPLLMRGQWDHRPAAQVKAAVVKEVADSGIWDEVVLYDDDPAIIQAVQATSGAETGKLTTWYRKPPRLSSRSAWTGVGN